MGINEKAWHVGFKWTIGNEDVPCGALAVDNTSKQLHICDIADANTDWAVAVVSHPTVYIHSATTPATKYIKMYHDATNAYIDAVGATALSILIAGTAELSLTSSALSPGVTDSSALGTTALMWSDLFLASGGVINFDNGNLTMTHSDGKLSLAATWATAAMTGRPFISTLTQNAAGGAYFNALKGQLTFGAAGSTTGIASAICAEVSMSTVDASGAYVCLELEMTHPGSGGGQLAQPAFIYANATGTTSDTWFDVWGAFITLGTGVTAGADNILSVDSQTLKMRMGALQATVRHLVMSQAENYLSHSITTIAADGRIFKLAGGWATPGNPDGEGIVNISANITGQTTGEANLCSAWLNLGTDATILTWSHIHTDGFYDATATLTGAHLAWAKYTAQLAGNPQEHFIMDLNMIGANSGVDAIYNVNNPALALGYVATTAGTAIGSIPFFSTGGTKKYIMLYATPA